MNTDTIFNRAFRKDLERFFIEDAFARNFYYIEKLPKDLVECTLNFKSDTLVAGLLFFIEAFKYLGGIDTDLENIEEYEGRWIEGKSRIKLNFKLPFSVAVTGERVALNLLQHLSGIATLTKIFADKAAAHQIAILDTRKTLPGLRSLQKYAVRIGGGSNHRFGQTDMWMVKDNHKSFFGGVEKAVEFFKSINSNYMPIIVEIHTLDELTQAIELGLQYVLLDNFSNELLIEAIKIKPEFMKFEVSGGVNLGNIDNYLLKGVDTISVGQLTSNAPRADISLKFERFFQ